MKNFLLLLFAVAIVVVFGGTAFYHYDTSKGARFERLDQPNGAELPETAPSSTSSPSRTDDKF